MKEKLLAAKRGGIKTVIIPKANEKDLLEIPQDVTEGISIFCASHMDEVLEKALFGMQATSEFDRLPEKTVSVQERSDSTH